MNNLIRPGLYGAYHDIVPVETINRESFVADIVGPVCETTDYLARGWPKCWWIHRAIRLFGSAKAMKTWFEERRGFKRMTKL